MISQEIIDELKANPRFKEAGEELECIYQDSEAMMFSAIQVVIQTLCADLRKIASNGIISEDKDDKNFDRVNNFMKTHSDYIKSIRVGNERLQKIGLKEKEKESKKGTFFDAKAKEKNGRV